MAVQYRWATLGCGVIGHQLAEAMQKLGGNLYAVGNRTHAKAVQFAEQYGIGKVYDKIEDMFQDPDVDIIYISTPHNTHIKYLRQALAAGKHVLCEKSITLNYYELEEAVKLAMEHHLVLAEAQTIYHMPIYRALRERIDRGDFGPLRLMTLNAHYRAPLSFSEETIREADKNIKKIESTMKTLALKLQSSDIDLSTLEGGNEDAFFDEMCNDLNTPNAITVLYAEVKAANQMVRVPNPDLAALGASFARIRDYLDILGLSIPYPVLGEEDKALYREYLEAKSAKDFSRSDALRAKLIDKKIL